MLYYENPYLKEGKFRIIKREGNRILLDDTILYPGGGGQPEDYGVVVCKNGNFPIRHTGNLWHEVGGNCEGEEIKIILDWERRYLLMRSHTAEHTFFRILEDMGAVMGKISLGEVSAIIFEGDVGVEDILKAEAETRRLIKEGREVRVFWIDRDDLGKYPRLRIKLERIRDRAIRVVEIEGHDLSACKGVHVANLSEIGDFAIVGVRMGRRKEVKFVVGDMARDYHYRASTKLRELIWQRNLNVERVENYVKNLEDENKRMLNALKEMSKDTAFAVESCGTVEIHTLYLPYGDYKILQRRAMEMANHRDAVVIYGVGENIVCMAYNERYVWAKDAYLALLKNMDGRGGGRGNFLSGSVNEPEKFVEKLKKIICEKAIHLHGGENGPV